jgi:uncharacterized protein
MEYSFQKSRIGGGIAADDEYWMALERGEFLLPVCAGCAAWIWPAHFRCGHCGSWEMNWVAVKPKGKIFTWTRTWYRFEGLRERDADIPFVTILAEIPEAGGARIMGVLKGDETGLRIGAAVHGEIDPPAEKTKGYATIRWVLDK